MTTSFNWISKLPYRSAIKAMKIITDQRTPEAIAAAFNDAAKAASEVLGEPTVSFQQMSINTEQLVKYMQQIQDQMQKQMMTNSIRVEYDPWGRKYDYKFFKN